jgi:hypothetical protein
MFTPSSNTARQLLAEFKKALPSETARLVLLNLQPLFAEAYRDEVSRALIELVPEAVSPDFDVLRTAANRTPAQLFELACECVSSVTCEKDLYTVRSRQAREVLSRYYVIFIMSQEMQHTGQIGYKEIGAMFSKAINHATIVYALDKVRGYLQTDDSVRSELFNITKLLFAHGHWRAAHTVKTSNTIKKNK